MNRGDIHVRFFLLGISGWFFQGSFQLGFQRCKKFADLVEFENCCKINIWLQETASYSRERAAQPLKVWRCFNYFFISLLNETMLLVVVKISDEHSELLRLPEGRRVFVLLVGNTVFGASHPVGLARHGRKAQPT